MLKKFFGVFVFTLLLTTLASRAQVVALKSDVLNWAAASLNIEPEVKVGKRSTIALGISWNPWTVKEDTKNRKWKHLLVQPEYRYWFCEAFGGHFLGLHSFYARFNAGNVKLPFGIWDGLQDNRYQGNLFGAGIGYGYHWILKGRWAMEAEVGLGFGYLDYDRYDCVRCGTHRAAEDKWVFMPTKLSLSFIYVFK